MFCQNLIDSSSRIIRSQAAAAAECEHRQQQYGYKRREDAFVRSSNSVAFCIIYSSILISSHSSCRTTIIQRPRSPPVGRATSTYRSSNRCIQQNVSAHVNNKAMLDLKTGGGGKQTRVSAVQWAVYCCASNGKEQQGQIHTDLTLALFAACMSSFWYSRGRRRSMCVACDMPSCCCRGFAGALPDNQRSRGLLEHTSDGEKFCDLQRLRVLCVDIG